MTHYHKKAATTRFRTLVFPGAQLLINLTLLGYQVIKLLLGMPDWLALLSQARDTAVSAYQFMKAVAALPQAQNGDTPRINRDVPPSC